MPRSGVRNRANKGIDFPLYHTFAALPTSRDRLKAYLLIGKIVPSFQTFVNSSLAAIRRQSETFREPLNNKPCILVKHAIQAFFQNTGLIFTQICFFAGWLLFSEKGQTSPLIYVVESFRPAIASEYKLAQANRTYKRFSFFFNPR